MATVAAVAGALPEQSATQEELWELRFRDFYDGDRAAGRLWTRCGVGRRYGVIDPVGEKVYEWGTEQRMRRFVEEALPLGRAALGAALERAELRPDEVDQLTVVSCTGYATPGLDILLAQRARPAARRAAPAHRPHGLLRGAPCARDRRERR